MTPSKITHHEIIYTKPGAVVRLMIPSKQDWDRVGDSLAGKLFPGFDPERPDPAFDLAMENLRVARIAAKKKKA